MAKIFVTRMLTRDLFAVANLVVGDDVLQHVCADRSADNYMSAVSCMLLSARLVNNSSSGVRHPGLQGLVVGMKGRS